MTNLDKKLWTMMSVTNNKYGTIPYDNLVDIFSPEACIADVDLRPMLLVYFGYLLGCATYIYSDYCGSEAEARHEKRGIQRINDFIKNDHLDHLCGADLKNKAANVILKANHDINYSNVD